MNNEEYDKILQLVKSDCPNNRLLGFQLAKGLDYDLIELLIEMFVGNNFIIIGNCEMDMFNPSSGEGWYFKLFKQPRDTMEINLVYFVECVSDKYFELARKKCMEQFINLIINE